jgi:transforming growth factor-beta-induced protein
MRTLFASALIETLKGKAELTATLTCRVVPGTVMAADVVELKKARTVQGQMIEIDTSMGVKVDGAHAVETDIACSNGVIHVADSVILPNQVRHPGVWE